MSEDSQKPRLATDPDGPTGERAAIDPELSEAELAELDRAPALSALLKRALAEDEPETNDELLASVQRKLRNRSKGKFYGDGWSTTESRVSYALIAGVMLVTIVAVYLALGPTGFSLR